MNRGILIYVRKADVKIKKRGLNDLFFMVGIKRRNSNFFEKLNEIIDEIITLLQLPETIAFLEKFSIYKLSAEFV